MSSLFLFFSINSYRVKNIGQYKYKKETRNGSLPNGPELTSVSTVKPRDDKARPVDPVVTKFTRLKKLKLSLTNFIIDA